MKSSVKAKPKSRKRPATPKAAGKTEPKPKAPRATAAEARNGSRAATAKPASARKGRPSDATRTEERRPARKRTRPAAAAQPAPAAEPKAAPAEPKPAPAAEPKGSRSKKPKPPAKTMNVPPPTAAAVRNEPLPDMRRAQYAGASPDGARGRRPNDLTRPRDAERDETPPVDATMIMSSLATDVQPKMEDNYDYSVLDGLAASPWCPAPTRMLNMGCGSGEAAVYFANRGFKVVAIDSNRTAVGLARERAWLSGSDIDFMVGDLFEIPNLLPAESFGLAVDRGAFFRLEGDRDRQRYLGNVRRLLFRGGVLFLSAGFFPLEEDRKARRSGAAKKPGSKILLVQEGGMVVNELRQAGFELLRRELRQTADSGDFGELLLTLRK